MPTVRQIFLCVTVAMLLAPPGSAQTEPAPPPTKARFAQAIERADADLAALWQENRLPALQAAVLVDGEIVFSRAYGLADLDSVTKATPQTRFRIASISKALTGTVLARLAARGEIDLDQPISEYVADLPEDWAAITARQLASHTAGIRHYRGLEIYSNREYASLSDALDIFDDDPLRFEPGTQRGYSTYGFTLLGVAMEHASERDFFDLLKVELLDPLKMASTTRDGDAPDLAATPYILDNELDAHVAPPTNSSYKIPGGGLASTVDDLVRLAWAVIEPGHLDADTLALLRTRSESTDGEVFNYSLGWNVSGEPGHLRLSHGGSQPGSRCFLLADIDAGIGVAILCNARGAPIGLAEAERIAGYFKAAK